MPNRRGQQPLNPLDRLFLATSLARENLQLGGADIHLHLECNGTIELNGLRRAYACAARRYPAITAGLQRSTWRQNPRWNLKPNAESDGVTLHNLPEPAALQHALEKLLIDPINLRAGPLLRFHVFRRAGASDTIAMRWPHALMDARGGATLLETIAADYAAQTDPDTLTSLRDEHRTDFGTLTLPTTWRERIHATRAKAPPELQPPPWKPLHLTAPAPVVPGERPALVIRRLSSAQLHTVNAAALQVCGLGRFADFVRASGIAALHRTLQPTREAAAGYSTNHLLDNRKRRDPGPVCHNIFSSVPLYIPLAEADDRAAIAERIAAATRLLLDRELQTQRLAALDTLTQIPPRWLAIAMARSLRTNRALLPIGMTNPVSLPMGFMGPLSKPVPEFCGATLTNIYGTRAASPIAGYSVSVNTAQDRLNLCAIHYPHRVPRDQIEQLLQNYEALLLAGASS